MSTTIRCATCNQGSCIIPDAPGRYERHCACEGCLCPEPSGKGSS